ncbi:MAG TPA: hypothetical protein DD766_01405 [Desulfovibrio sp.]|jgi:glycosyltransferase involved in cell wall biosynthesis|nr:hypothetical protein [Desulfovibrio sp.]HBR05793.1 hypothetical protein [Desulfovibrio sp.]
MSEPKITVYIPTRNNAAYLSEAVDSVLRQTADQWELLIVDDGSEDNTADVLRLYQGDDRIRTFRTEGIGLPGVCNLALSHCRGRYLIRLDGDDIFDENILLVLGNYLDRRPDVALVFPDYFLVDESGEVLSLERRPRLYCEDHVLDTPPNGACALIRVDVLKGLNGYREDLGAQDGFDLWTRVSRRHECANVNLPLFYYRRHSANITNNSERILMARRAIKRDAAASLLADYRPLQVVIPCRRNYDFREDLWKASVNGKTLLEDKIETCLASPLFDRVVVACDNLEARDLVAGYGDPRLSFFQRDRADTIRSVNIAQLLGKVAAEADPEFKGATMLNLIPTPFVTLATMEEAVHTMVMNQADSAMGVDELAFPVYRRTPDGLQAIGPRGEFRSELNRLYYETRTSLATRNANLSRGSLTGSRIVYFQLHADEHFFINSERSLKIARLIREDRA